MSGQYHVYIPFQDDSLCKDIHDLWVKPYSALLGATPGSARAMFNSASLPTSSQARVEDRKRPIISVHGHSKPLMVSKAVPDKDTIYIVGHCCPDGKTLTDNKRNPIDEWELVWRMQQDGINPRHVNFKLWCCEGGKGIVSFAALVFGVMRYGNFSAPPPYPKAILSAYTLPLYKAIDPITGHRQAAGATGVVRPSQCRCTWPAIRD